jgi:lipopolysaccharide biosynthesis protein
MSEARLIAFYLPQFHPIPENDLWWGKDFTEWTNVRNAAPRFHGHNQPHMPGQLGYYDLRSADVRAAQAALAREYGIHGFCYYHYWFNGRRLLEGPFAEVLRSGKPDFPFCLCWANENWTRRWDGDDKGVLIAQKYSHEDDRRHMESLVPAFRDDRYIRIDGRPVFLVYKTNLLPDPKKTAEVWRDTAKRMGLGDIYLIRIENYFQGRDPVPAEIGFDAAVEFAPHWGSAGQQVTSAVALCDEAVKTNPMVYDYDNIMTGMLVRPNPGYKLFRGIFPGWDNSARRANSPTIFINSAPEKYAFWLSQIIRYTFEHFAGDERLIFINAWNEWGEGCHVEPDEKYGLQYLEATRVASRLAEDFLAAVSRIGPATLKLPFSPDKWYRILASTYHNKAEISQEDLNLLGSVSPFALFSTMLLRDKGWQEYLDVVIRQKDSQIAALHDSLSWKITLPLRKIHRILFG